MKGVVEKRSLVFLSRKNVLLDILALAAAH
jgi:hypothetical protein